MGRSGGRQSEQDRRRAWGVRIQSNIEFPEPWLPELYQSVAAVRWLRGGRHLNTGFADVFDVVPGFGEPLIAGDCGN